MNNPELVEAGKVAKRSLAYRQRRDSMASVAPVDVWADPEAGVYIVLFPLRAQDALESFLGFVISIRDYRLVSTEILSVQLSPDGWQAHVFS